jgi:MFS family permease
MTTDRIGVAGRIARWVDAWGALLPILLAEFIVLLGFGALLPVLPLYVQEQGIDAATLGLIIAGWSIAKLVAEPIFGWLADRHARKPQMLIGLVILAVSTMLPVLLTSAVAMFALRIASGIGAGMYDPAARGIIVDATDEDERGEAFGIYAAFQMGGFLFGPVIGVLGASLGGGFAFPFVLTGVLTLVAAGLLLVTLPSHPHVHARPHPADSGRVQPPADVPFTPTATPHTILPDRPAPTTQAPLGRLANRFFLAALVMGFGAQLAFGVYEVVWSLFMTGLGASIEWVGLTFVLFGLPTMVLSPIAGRIVDRRGPFPFALVGGLVIMLAGVLYAASTEPVFPSLVVPFEAVAEAFMNPALYAMVALGTPLGRSATAQGIFGAVGTIALIAASLAAGALWDLDRLWPFGFFVAGLGACLAVGALIHRLGPSLEAAEGAATGDGTQAASPLTGGQGP